MLNSIIDEASFFLRVYKVAPIKGALLFGGKKLEK
jgi:hypothetical protein